MKTESGFDSLRDAQEMKQQQEAESWEHSLQCSPLPDVTDAAGLHAYFAEAASRTHKDIASVLHTCQVYRESNVSALLAMAVCLLSSKGEVR